MLEASSPSSNGGDGVAPRGSRQPALMGTRGTTRIDDGVVEMVAGIAAREVAGVRTMGGGLGRAITDVTQRVGLGDERRQGVSVEVGDREVAVDLNVVLDYGANVPRVAQEIRDNVIRRIEFITGLHVTEVNVVVSDVRRPGDDAESDPRVR
jgi:uncharacterized alkaline shock family protein YloU